jgi:predicted  nucleic acid-binding Zn-ribbon protein
MPLSLEERERIAYITNSPDHALIVRAIEGDEEVHANLEAERDEHKEAADSLEREKSELESDLETAETRIQTLSGQVEDLEIELGDLKEKVHAAGVDLV